MDAQQYYSAEVALSAVRWHDICCTNTVDVLKQRVSSPYISPNVSLYLTGIPNQRPADEHLGAFTTDAL